MSFANCFTPTNANSTAVQRPVNCAVVSVCLRLTNSVISPKLFATDWHQHLVYYIRSLHEPARRLSYLDTVTATEVADVIRLLPQSAEVLPLDVIPVSLLKLSTDIMSPLIARLANLSFKDGVFPSRYKAAQVTPLLKKPNLSPHEPANYRPISDLCTFSKILLKLVLSR